MNIFIATSYEELSTKVADDVIQHMNKSAHPLFCPASGDTPTGLYHELVQRQQEGLINTRQWSYVGLDEWSGMNGADEGSCRYYLDKQLFNPLQVNEERICFFNGRSANAINECDRVEQFIRMYNGIDVVVLGLGMNGHVGMNEPGVDPSLFSHVAELDSVTKQVGQKYFSSAQTLTQGSTLGIASIMQARHVILMVNGEKKAAIVQEVIEGEITPLIPASLLRNHASFNIFIDDAGASKLTNSLK